MKPQIGTWEYLYVLITSCSWCLGELLVKDCYVQIVNHIFIATDHDPYDELWVVPFVLEDMGEVLLLVIMWSWLSFNVLMIRCVVLPLVVLCERRLHETSPSFGLGEGIVEFVCRRWVAGVIEIWTPVYELFHKGLFWIQLFNHMVRFILIISLIVADACMENLIIRYLFKLGQYLRSGPPTQHLSKQWTVT